MDLTRYHGVFGIRSIFSNAALARMNVSSFCGFRFALSFNSAYIFSETRGMSQTDTKYVCFSRIPPPKRSWLFWRPFCNSASANFMSTISCEKSSHLFALKADNFKGTCTGSQELTGASHTDGLTALFETDIAANSKAITLLSFRKARICTASNSHFMIQGVLIYGIFMHNYSFAYLASKSRNGKHQAHYNKSFHRVLLVKGICIPEIRATKIPIEKKKTLTKF